MISEGARILTKPTVRIKYPVSRKILRFLKPSDLISYAGKAFCFTCTSLELFAKYEKLEGAPLVDLSQEIVVLGTVENEVLFLDKRFPTPEELEYLFLRGVSATIGRPVTGSHITELYMRFGRVHFVPTEEFSFIHDDVTIMAKSVELDDLILYVNVASNGSIYLEG